MVMDQETMETLPAPDVVGREFVRQYYTLLNEAPEHAHRFYNAHSYFVHGSMTKPAIGQLEIHEKIQQLNFRDCHAKISQVDSQVTLGNGVVVQVSGELSNDGLPMRRFSQTFVLGTQSPKKYYVHNDIFRYQDMLQSDDEPEREDSNDLEQEQQQREIYQSVPVETAPLLPPQPIIPQQAPPVPPPGLNVNAPPHMIINGTGTGRDHVDEPLAVVEQQPVIIKPEPVPAPIVNGMGGNQDLGRVIPTAAPLPEPTPIRQAVLEANLELNEPVAVEPITNNRDTYEDDNYSTHSIDPNEKKTYANLCRAGPRGGRGGGPPRTVRSTAPPPHSAPYTPTTPQQQQQQQTMQNSPPSSNATSSYNQQQSSPPEPTGPPPRYINDSQQVFMGNIPPDATESELKVLFGDFGKVVELRINRSRDARGCFGFVTFEESSAVAACLKNKYVDFNGSQINVEEKKRNKPMGGGGGDGSGSWSAGRGSSGRGGRGQSRGAPRGGYAPRGGSGPPPPSSRHSYPSKR